MIPNNSQEETAVEPACLLTSNKAGQQIGSLYSGLFKL